MLVAWTSSWHFDSKCSLVVVAIDSIVVVELAMAAAAAVVVVVAAAAAAAAVVGVDAQLLLALLVPENNLTEPT